LRSEILRELGNYSSFDIGGALDARRYFITGLELCAAFLQGLKPPVFLLPGGMAEAMPF
jgi:hypothetical protein